MPEISTAEIFATDATDRSMPAASTAINIPTDTMIITGTWPR